MSVRPFAPRPVEPNGAALTALTPGADRDGSAIFRRGREIASLLLIACSVFLTLGLMSFRHDPGDPAITGADWVGPVGAEVAAVLVQGFGLVAWLTPVEFVLIAAPLLRGKTDDSLGLRLAGDLVIAVVLAALVQVAVAGGVAFGGMPAGGNVGLFFGEIARGLFSTVGSFFVGATVIGLLLVSRHQLSFIRACQRLWDGGRLLWTAGLGGVWRMYGAWTAARELREQERAKTQPPPTARIVDKLSDEAIIAQLADDEPDWPTAEDDHPHLSLADSIKSAGSVLVLPVEESSRTAPRVEREEQPEVSGPAPRVRRSRVKREDAVPSEVNTAMEPEASATPDPDATGASVEIERLGRVRKPNARTARRSDATEEATIAEAASTEVVAPAATEVIADAGSSDAPGGPKIVEMRETALHQPMVQQLELEPVRPKAAFKLPGTELLKAPSANLQAIDQQLLLEKAGLLEKTLADYGVSGKVEEIHPGPTVTTFEVSPQAGTKVSKVKSISDDLALGLSSKVRIVAPIPGKNRVGFEVPNDVRVPVSLRELVEDQRFHKLAAKAPLPVVLGRNIVGTPFYADLASLPHLIVAGSTGSGKSVGLNVMLSSLLFCRSPDDLRMLMIDPKVVELAPFDGIPHMLLPVVTDMKQAATALRWAVDEMERRYQLFANAHTKNISTYNGWVERVRRGEVKLPAGGNVEAIAPDGTFHAVPAAKDGSDGAQLPDKLPFIVIVVDEFADLMMQQGKEVETSVARLAQKSRAAGMHVVLATQRPSVDVITGMIKANFPSRIAFRVAQRVDSRTILDEQGAENLLGNGDMLVKLNGTPDTHRVQCPFVSEEEVSALTDYLRAQGTPEYNEDILKTPEEEGGDSDDDERVDSRFDEAVEIVATTQRCSTSWLQRKMTIGYNRAAKIVELMEKRGIVGPANGAKDREVLVSPL